MLTDQSTQVQFALSEPRPVLASLGQGDRGAIDRRGTLDFAGLTELVSTPKQNPMLHSDFMSSNETRNKAKAGDPFVAFASFKGNKRHGSALEYRSALALDFDHDAAELLAALVRNDVLAPCAYVWHTTRSHKPDAPRLRVIIPLGRDVSRAEHRTLVQAVAPLFLAKLDPGSYEAERIMYRPVQNQGAEFKSGAHAGEGYLNPDYYLANVDPEEEKPASQVPVRPTLAVVDDGFAALIHAVPPLGDVTLDVARTYLDKIDPDLPEPEWMNVLRGMHHQGTGLGDPDAWLEAAIEWSATGEKYEEGVVEEKWHRLTRSPAVKPTTFATVIMMAGGQGAAKPSGARFPLRSAADLANAPPMAWLVRGMLPLEGLAALFGPSGSGKSFLVLDVAAAVAGGEPEWFERRVTQCPVTYCALEGEAGMGKRVKAWAKHHGKPLPDGLRFMTAPFDLLDGAGVAELARSIESAGGAGGMVVLDTLNRAAPGADENSSVDMGQIIAAAKRLQDLLGGLVLLVHHTGKDATKGLRGHSSLHAALDCAIEVIATDSRREWRVAKSKDDETGTVEAFQLTVVSLGKDEYGDPITSCVVLPDESVQAVKRAKLPAGGNQKIALNAVTEALRNSFETGNDGAPEGRPCIRLDEAITLVAERMLCDQKHKKPRAREAVTGLVAKDILGMKGDWLWRV
jgi:hypothetical protein